MNMQHNKSLKSALLMAAAVLTAGALAGCSDDGNGGGNNNPANNAANNTTNNAPNNDTPNNDTPNNAPTACSSDDQCGDGEVCDTDSGVCRDGCAGDGDCDANSQCGDGGFCEPRQDCDADNACAGADEACNTCVGRCELVDAGARPCQTDTNCFVEEFCDPCRSICRPQGQRCDPCTDDAECGGAGDLCLDFNVGGSFCGTECAGNADCPRGFICSETGDGASQCVPASGDCADPAQCDDDGDCPAGQRCGTQGACVEGCTPGTCPNDQVCDAGSCVPPCASDADCPDGAECQPDGTCRIPGGCLTSRDCPDPGTYCNTSVQMCEPGCELDSDCPSLQICSANQCRTRPCDGNYLCAFGQVCDFDTGQCVTAEGPYCDPCDAEGSDQCGGEPNQCLRIQDEEGNPVGDFCGVGCDPDNIDACPVGYSCVELMDQNMQVTGAVCFRDCARDPI